MDNEEKIWFIAIDNKQEGPYSILELQRDIRISPETLVWKQGFENWVPIRTVAELKDVFKDTRQPKKDEEEPEIKKLKIAGDEELALNLQADFPPVFWFFVMLLAITYILYQVYISK